MKNYFYTFILVCGIMLSTLAYTSYKEYKKYKGMYEKEAVNVAAYENLNAGLNGEIRQFQYTVDQLAASRDSINQKLLVAAEQLKIKDKNIKYLQYHSSIITKTDTITIKGDTIFRDKKVDIDTLVKDNWYSLNLKLQYPSTIVASPTFRSEKYVIIHAKKEYVNKPSKIFFIRWFQKKRTVVTVDIKEENPYIEEKENRFIEIVK